MWNPESWKNFKISQQPDYDAKSQARITEIEGTLSSYPPIISFSEVDRLRAHLAMVERGDAFILQGGDCAEAFSQFSEMNLKNYFRLFLQMNAILMFGIAKPIIKIGRIAGQYAKPRSSSTEMIDGTQYQSYRGDIVNAIDLDHEKRKPNPERILETYFHSAATRNFIENLARNGFSSLENISKWNDEFLQICKIKDIKFDQIVEQIRQCFSFLGACNITNEHTQFIREATFYTSHEALLLNYEQGLTRFNKDNGKWYCLSAHQLWIGDRTRKIDEAHVEFLRGVENPIGVKVGPTTNPEDLIRIIDKLNPHNANGKIILISRMGVDNISQILPNIIKSVNREGKNVIWQTDPMHGNVIKTENGTKTRRFEDIFNEVILFFKIHKSLGTYPGGVHLEMTGNNVTECLGGSQKLTELDLKDRYHTHCDPRLNSSQSLELAFLIADNLKT